MLRTQEGAAGGGRSALVAPELFAQACRLAPGGKEAWRCRRGVGKRGRCTAAVMATARQSAQSSWGVVGSREPSGCSWCSSRGCRGVCVIRPASRAAQSSGGSTEAAADAPGQRLSRLRLAAVQGTCTLWHKHRASFWSKTMGAHHCLEPQAGAPVSGPRSACTLPCTFQVGIICNTH